jgi:hypothetical protein
MDLTAMDGLRLHEIDTDSLTVSYSAKIRGGQHAMNLSSQDLELYWLSNAPRKSIPASRPLVPVYRVGEPLQRGRRHWPVGSQYTHGPNGHELTLFLPEIDDRHVQDVKSGEGEFAVIARLPLIVLAYRFGQSIPWSDVPYCWHMQPAHYRVVPPLGLSPEARALLWITLVGAHDGIIYAQRGMTLAPEFTRFLHGAIRAQARMPFIPDRCTAAISKLLVAHLGTLERLPLAQARTIGNQ